MSELESHDRRVLVRAAALVDATGTDARPGVVLLEHGRIVAAGSPRSVGAVPGARVVDAPGALVLPPLVNAHAHLDLTHLGPRPYGGSFSRWIDDVRAGRLADETALAASVRRGAELARAGGTALIGDVAGAGSPVPRRVLSESGLAGTSFLELFGIGRGQDAALARMSRLVEEEGPAAGPVRLGVQPHAPYSCGERVFRAAAALGLPLATHLAETPEERRFVASGDGPLADMLRRFGAWDETIRGTGRHPVDWLLDAIGDAPCLAAHLNDVEPEHVERLAGSCVSVAYCPRASAYFGHPCSGEAPHRYREMMQAGTTVALGTDSIVCLDTPDRISVLDDMRLLYRRDSTDPTTLLAMATVAGAAALGIDPGLVTLRPGPVAGLIALPFGDADDPLRSALRGDAPPVWIDVPCHAPVSGATPAGSAAPRSRTP